jgi:hypothetical protein
VQDQNTTLGKQYQQNIVELQHCQEDISHHISNNNKHYTTQTLQNVLIAGASLGAEILLFCYRPIIFRQTCSDDLRVCSREGVQTSRALRHNIRLLMQLLSLLYYNINNMSV